MPLFSDIAPDLRLERRANARNGRSPLCWDQSDLLEIVDKPLCWPALV